MPHVSHWLSAPLRAESLAITAVGTALIVVGTGWTDGAEAGAALVTGAALFVFGLLLPRLRGRLKLGPVEGELSPEALSKAIESGGAKEGLSRKEIEELKTVTQRLLAHADAPVREQRVGLPDDKALENVGVQCADCGTLAAHENAARLAYGFLACPSCGSTARRLIGSPVGAAPSPDA